MKKNECFVIAVIGVVICAVSIGIGYAIGKNKYDKDDNIKKASLETFSQRQKKRYSHHNKIMYGMKNDSIKESLRDLASTPHYPGSERNFDLAKEFQAKWKEYGFDYTELFKYKVYLSYPEKPSRVLLHHDNSTKVLQTLTIDNEPQFDESEKENKNLLPPFNVFSASGTVTSELVYVNYGRDSDFDAVKKAGIDVTGKIILARYGKSSRSQIVRRVEEQGAIGVIIFSDPYDYVYPGKEYPKGWMLNRYGVQRGTVNRLAGDALSLGYPSKEGYFRLNESKYDQLDNPKVLSQPISYGTVYDILKWMENGDDNTTLPAGFQGGLNITYKLHSGINRRITLEVLAKYETKDTYTVCGTLYGKDEPDRYVLLGNHYDAWTYGASDPSSGTAAMIEIVKALGGYKKESGWRPRRTIMVCSWGSEEPGIQGSTEWADENHKFLTTKVVVYLNVDMAVEGNFTMRLRGTYIATDGVFETAKNIPSADDPSVTLFEDWRIKSAILAKKSQTEFAQPVLYSVMGSGSDFKSLWQTYGTTSLDFRYDFSELDYPRLSNNPHYHTAYESFGWMSELVDPYFMYHLTVGRIMLRYALKVADANLIPFNLIQYTDLIKTYLDRFIKRYNSTLFDKGITFDVAKSSLRTLIEKAKQFHRKVNSLKEEDISDIKLRMINDKLMNFERNFLLNGIVKSPHGRHVVFATIYRHLYVEKFPGISEAIYECYKNPKCDFDEIRKQITMVVWCFDTATRSLDLNE